MDRVASTSQEDDQVAVTAVELGLDIDPTTDGVWFVYQADDTTPAAADPGWITGRWETWTVTGPVSPYIAVITLGGVDTALTPASSPYRRWLKILHAGNTIIRPAGTLTVY